MRYGAAKCHHRVVVTVGKLSLKGLIAELDLGNSSR